jgi:hypothetical protein
LFNKKLHNLSELEEGGVKVSGPLSVAPWGRGFQILEMQFIPWLIKMNDLLASLNKCGRVPVDGGCMYTSLPMQPYLQAKKKKKGCTLPSPPTQIGVYIYIK